MNIAIFNNKKCELSKECYRILKMTLDTAKIIYYDYDGISFEPSTDFVIVIGGDGSILKIADQSAYSGIPILGINTGRIGFLTETEKVEDIELAVSSLLSGNYTIDKRTMLEVVDNDACYFALNEVVVSRADNLNIVSITLKTNGDILEKYNGDGVIVSTPTGSTAYSLSAGGPVLAPQVAAILVTPICPHTLHSRSIVLSDDAVIEIDAKLRGEGIIVIDGKKKINFCNQGNVTIKRSNKCSNFVRFGGPSFYSKLLNKLTQWSDIDSNKFIE